MKILVRIVFWTIPCLFLVAAVWHYYGLSGSLTVERKFPASSPFISDVLPAFRVKLKGKLPFIIDEPIYIDVRMPRFFSRVTVWLDYENSQNLPIKFGAKLKSLTPDDWKFDFRPLKTLPLVFEVASLELRDHKLRFILSSPTLTVTGGGITLHSVKVLFEGTSLLKKLEIL